MPNDSNPCSSNVSKAHGSSTESNASKSFLLNAEVAEFMGSRKSFELSCRLHHDCLALWRRSEACECRLVLVNQEFLALIRSVARSWPWVPSTRVVAMQPRVCTNNWSLRTQRAAQSILRLTNRSTWARSVDCRSPSIGFSAIFRNTNSEHASNSSSVSHLRNWYSNVLTSVCQPSAAISNWCDEEWAGVSPKVNRNYVLEVIEHLDNI